MQTTPSRPVLARATSSAVASASEPFLPNAHQLIPATVATSSSASSTLSAVGCVRQSPRAARLAAASSISGFA